MSLFYWTCRSPVDWTLDPSDSRSLCNCNYKHTSLRQEQSSSDQSEEAEAAWQRPIDTDSTCDRVSPTCSFRSSVTLHSLCWAEVWLIHTMKNQRIVKLKEEKHKHNKIYILKPCLQEVGFRFRDSWGAFSCSPGLQLVLGSVLFPSEDNLTNLTVVQILRSVSDPSTCSFSSLWG